MPTITEPFTVHDGEGQPWLGYDQQDAYFDESDLDDLIADYGEKDGRVEEIREHGFVFDDDEDRENWANLCDDLTEWMKEITPAGADLGSWQGEVRNFGWRHQSGSKPHMIARTGKALLDKVLPDTQCTFRIYYCTDAAGHRGLAINNAHHDAPMGGEMYYLFPYTEEDEENEEEGEIDHV